MSPTEVVDKGYYGTRDHKDHEPHGDGNQNRGRESQVDRGREEPGHTMASGLGRRLLDQGFFLAVKRSGLTVPISRPSLSHSATE